MNIVIKSGYVSPANRDIEIVERKGIGHPDSVADGIAETISVEYSKYCLENFGIILHHNVDKINALGGLARIEWGSNEIIHPLRIILNGRISASFGDKEIPVNDICVHAAKKFLKSSLPNLDLEKNVRYILEHTTYSKNPHWFKPRSINDLPEYTELYSNDTSAIVASSPLTLTEKLVLATEGFFYDDLQNPKYPECGQDIKVMAVRKGKDIDLTVCLPIMLKLCKNPQDYWDISDSVSQALKEFLTKQLPVDYNLKLTINSQYRGSRSASDAKHFYAVVGGSAFDFGEEGLVGRGNNRIGIIPALRAFSMEAAYGKNPVYHVGKVLGTLADDMSMRIYNLTSESNEVMLVAKNGDPLFSPSLVFITVKNAHQNSEIQRVVEEAFEQKNWTQRIVNEELIVPRTGNIILQHRYGSNAVL